MIGGNGGESDVFTLQARVRELEGALAGAETAASVLRVALAGAEAEVRALRAAFALRRAVPGGESGANGENAANGCGNG